MCRDDFGCVWGGGGGRGKDWRFDGTSDLRLLSIFKHGGGNHKWGYVHPPPPLTVPKTQLNILYQFLMYLFVSEITWHSLSLSLSLSSR